MAVSKIRAVLFETVTRCNLDCNYCYNCWKAVPDYPRGQLSTRKTIKMLRKIVRESGADQLAFTGGEPLLRDDLPDLIAALTLMGCAVSVLTNGMLMTPEWATDLKRTGARLVQLTLLSMDEELHDWHCGKGAFKGIINAAGMLTDAGMRIAMTIVVTNRTVDELPRLMEYMKSIGQKSFLLNRYNPGGRKVADGSYPELMLTKEENNRLLRHAEEGAVKLDMLPAVAVPIPPCVVDRNAYPHVRFAGCAAATDDAYYTLDPLGNIRMCNHSPEILGNILKDHFLEIANCRQAADWVSVKPDFCKPCPGWDRCKAGCRAVVQQMGQPLTELDPWVAACLGDRLHNPPPVG